MKTAKTLLVGVLVVVLFGMIAEAKTKVTKEPFGKMPDGTPVEIYTLADKSVEARISTYGGIVVTLKTADRKGKMDDVVLGFDNLDGYVQNSNGPSASFFGAIIGRYANRIAHGSFSLDGKTYSLPKNNGENTLHGGPHGFNNRVWDAKTDRLRSGTHLSEQRRRGGISGEPDRGGALHAAGERPAH